MLNKNVSDVIGIGAEAILYKSENFVLKNRVAKGYRLTQIDQKLRKARTKKEAKIIRFLYEKSFPVPILSSGEDNYSLKMSFISGKKIRDCLDNSNLDRLCKEVARFVAGIHDLGIVHGDLTTSNMILNNSDKKIYFIDFGLSANTAKIEDKAVDLHLFHQAMESKHFLLEKEGMKIFLGEYERCSVNGKETVERLRKVEERGRNKIKI